MKKLKVAAQVKNLCKICNVKGLAKKRNSDDNSNCEEDEDTFYLNLGEPRALNSKL